MKISSTPSGDGENERAAAEKKRMPGIAMEVAEKMKLFLREYPS